MCLHLYNYFSTHTAMKNLSLLILLAALFSYNLVLSQEKNNSLPLLQNLDGKDVIAQDILSDQVPTILVFWKTNEQKCCEQIELMINAREILAEITSVKIVAICTVSDGISSRIKPIVYGKNWDIDVYIDPNGNFKRSMNIVQTPFTIVYDQNQQIICKYNGYCAGADELVCEQLKSCIVSTAPIPSLALPDDE